MELVVAKKKKVKDTHEPNFRMFLLTTHHLLFCVQMTCGIGFLC